MKSVIGHIAGLILKLVTVAVIICALYRLGDYCYDFGQQLYSEQGVSTAPGRDVAVVVFEGESVKEIADMLEGFGLIKDSKVFLVQERLSRYHGQIKAGNYVLNTSMSGNDMIEILSGQQEEEKHDS